MVQLIQWIEIPTIDFDRAVNFYNQLLNIEMEKHDFGTEKMACFPSGEGAIIYEPNYKPSENGVIIHLHVADSIEQSITRIENLGGKLIKPKTKIEVEGKGFFAIFLDSEGNRLGLYEANFK
jgi:predicted enzyme related to lactoylglutathione lyase